MENLESKIQAILERNKRVEADKAWEISLTRRGFISLMTYGIACLFLWLIESPNFYFTALVPTGGYIISTLSIPWLKTRWIKSRSER